MAAIDPSRIKSKLAYTHKGTLYAVCADALTGKLYAGSDDYGIHVFDPAVNQKQPVARWARHENYVSALLHVKSAGKPLLISGSYDRCLIWWDLESGKPLRSIEAHHGWVRSLTATPDGRHFASAGDDMLVHIWETESGRRVRTLAGHAVQTPQGHVTALYAVATSPDGKYVAAGDRVGVVCIWELATGKLAQRFEVPILYTYDPKQRKRSIGGIRSLAFLPDGRFLAVGGIGQVNNVDGLAGPAHVELWDWRKPEPRLVLEAEGHKGITNCLLPYGGSEWLVGAGGGSDGGFLAFWKIEPLPASSHDKPAAVPLQRIKTGGHIHAFCVRKGGPELCLAGHEKLEIWS